MKSASNMQEIKSTSALVDTNVESIRRVPSVVALLYEHFAERYILDMLGYLAVEVGDVG